MNLTALLFLLVVVTLGLVFVRTRLQVSRASQLAELNWEDLLAKLDPVPVNEISKIAQDYLDPRKGQMELDRDALWAMIGKADGLRAMYSNSEILLALANYAQRWNFDESVVVCERMRRDAITLRRATFALSLGLSLGYDRIHVPFSVQEAASAYYLMRARLFALYETSHAARISRLAAVA